MGPLLVLDRLDGYVREILDHASVGERHVNANARVRGWGHHESESHAKGYVSVAVLHASDDHGRYANSLRHLQIETCQKQIIQKREI